MFNFYQVKQHSCSESQNTCKHIQSGTQYSNDIMSLEVDDTTDEPVIHLDYQHHNPFHATLGTIEQIYSYGGSTDTTHHLTLNMWESDDREEFDSLNPDITFTKQKNIEITNCDSSIESCALIPLGQEYSNKAIKVVFDKNDSDDLLYLEYKHNGPATINLNSTEIHSLDGVGDDSQDLLINLFTNTAQKPNGPPEEDPIIHDNTPHNNNIMPIQLNFGTNYELCNIPTISDKESGTYTLHLCQNNTPSKLVIPDNTAPGSFPEINTKELISRVTNPENDYQLCYKGPDPDNTSNTIEICQDSLFLYG